MTVMYKDIKPTDDFSLYVSISIAGGSGTGKTFSAMLLARGLTGGEPFAVIDTENKRALHYRADFPEMVHYNFGPEVDGEMLGFPPERWIALLDQIEKSGVKAVVIDSFSHAWEGINGVLELQAEVLERMSGGDQAKANRLGQLAWANVKPRYRRLIERIVQAKMDIIICIRAKPVMQERGGNARPTKLRRDDIPWDIASDKDLIFEMTASMILEPERPGQPNILKCPDHFRSLFSGADRLNVEAGEKMREWASEGGQDRATKDLLDEAEKVARTGTEAFKAWFKKLSAEKRPAVRTKMDQYKLLCDEADQADSDDPFGDDEDKGTEAPSPDADLFKGIAENIEKQIETAVDVDMLEDILKTWQPQIEQMLESFPKLHGDLTGKIEKRREVLK